MTDIETVFDVIVALGRRDAEVRMEGLATYEHGRATDAIIPFEALAELAAQGRVEIWEKDGEPVVYLTSLSAERLRLKLLPDSSRWVDRKTKFQPPARRKRKRKFGNMIVETDLDDETETPLDQRVDKQSMKPIDSAEMWERLVERRASMAKVATEAQMRNWDRMIPPEILMTGSLPYPVPEHDRGQWAPRAIPEAEDIARDWKIRWAEEWSAAHEGQPAPCYTCKGLPMPVGMLCEPCGRQGQQERFSGVLEQAKAENEGEWAAWEKRQAELSAENELAIEEIMARDDNQD